MAFAQWKLMCRCCHTAGVFKNLDIPRFDQNGGKETYSAMLHELFGDVILKAVDLSIDFKFTICEACIQSLQDAVEFKRQVFKGEEKLRNICSQMVPQEETIKSDSDLGVMSDSSSCIVKPSPRKKISSTFQTNRKKKDDKKTPRVGPTRIYKRNPLSDTHANNHKLRSNITVLLLNSTLCPFRRIASKYFCLYCDHNCIIFKELRAHVHEHHNSISKEDIVKALKKPKDLVKSDISIVICKMCQHEFKTLEDLIDHLVHIHDKVYYSSLKFKPSHGILAFNLSSEEFKCHICDQEFRFFKGLSEHMNEHGVMSMCHVCAKKFTSDHRLQTHMRMHSLNTLEIKCKHCDKTFNTIPTRDYHIKKVHNKYQYKCPECPEMFLFYSQRLKHMIEIHNYKKPIYKCNMCMKEFTSASILNTHIKRVHLKTTVFMCDVCSKIFHNKWAWKKHVNRHEVTI